MMNEERVVCAHCDGNAQLVTESREVSVGRRRAVAVVEFARCEDCAGESYLPGQMSAAQDAAGRAIRQEEGLLLPNEIRETRERYGLTQADFEKLLGVGTKTVVRWEKGSVFQNQATDTLLRLIRDDDRVARRLAEWRGVILDGARRPVVRKASVRAADEDVVTEPSGSWVTVHRRFLDRRGSIGSQASLLPESRSLCGVPA